MFTVQNPKAEFTYRGAVIGLLLLSVAALLVTVWVMVDFLHEQRIVQQLIRDLPPRDLPAARTLAGELRLQFRLTILVAINVVAAGVAVVVLWRAYHSSQGSLRDVQAFAKDILGSMDQAVITTDLDGLVTSLNSRGRELLSVQHDMIGIPLGELSSEIDLELFRASANQTGGATRLHDFLVRLAGREKCLRAICRPLCDRRRQRIGNVIQLRDVTNEHHIESRMRRMERYMGLGSLAAGLHHEIRNPLASLLLHVQLLEEQLDEAADRTETQEMLRIIKAEITRIGRVLESFRDFASVARLNVAPVDLRELVGEQVKLIRPRADQLGVKIRVSLSESVTPEVTVDRVRIEQVLLNLMLNAIQAMPDGGMLTVGVEPVDLAGTAAVRIRVDDTGMGVPESARPHILDPYFTTKSDGTGMGLALSDKIVRQHSGTLEFESSAAGSSFRVTLPVDGGELVAEDEFEREVVA